MILLKAHKVRPQSNRWIDNGTTTRQVGRHPFSVSPGPWYSLLRSTSRTVRRTKDYEGHHEIHQNYHKLMVYQHL